MATVRTIVNLELLSQGVPFRGKQGAAANAAADWLLTANLDGEIHQRIGSVGDAAAETLYDAANDLPATWDILFFWCDQNVHLQLLEIDSGSGTNVIISVLATFPFIMGDGDLAAVVSESPISNGATTLDPIDQVIVGNSSGSTANYVFAVIT